MSDPNGLVYHRGVYHMFFQHNPNGPVPGDMSWGHATSGDLVHWTQQPVAISSDETEQVYSGSVVVDHFNSSEFGSGGEPPLVAIYTSARPDGRQVQSLAYSLDGGMNWSKYAANPVLDRGSSAFRDPKVFWYQAGGETGYWVMVAVEADARQVVLYRSDNLRAWQYLSTFEPLESREGMWECPDLFPLPILGASQETVWVLVISVDPGRATDGTYVSYVVGQFDGVDFIAASELRRLDWGSDLYAAVTFAGVSDNRRILIGWMNNWRYAERVPTHPWRGTMSLPRELSVKSDGAGLALVQREPAEMRALELDGGLSIDSIRFEGSLPIKGMAEYVMDVSLEPVGAEECGVNLLVGDGQATRLTYQVATGQLHLDRSASGETSFADGVGAVATAPVTLEDGVLRLRIFVDRTSLEVFAQDGLVTLTSQVFPADGSTDLALFSIGGFTRVREGELTRLRSTDHTPVG
jgi:levanase/fructan beta-fructosidase